MTEKIVLCVLGLKNVFNQTQTAPSDCQMETKEHVSTSRVLLMCDFDAAARPENPLPEALFALIWRAREVRKFCAHVPSSSHPKCMSACEVQVCRCEWWFLVSPLCSSISSSVYVDYTHQKTSRQFSAITPLPGLLSAVAVMPVWPRPSTPLHLWDTCACPLTFLCSGLFGLQDFVNLRETYFLKFGAGATVIPGSQCFSNKSSAKRYSG